MRCNKAREDISLDLDGQLPPDRAAGLTRHLDDCGECRDYRADLVAGSRLLAAGEPQLAENFEWRLQLRLNQTLAQAAAQAIHPWEDGRAERSAWWRNFAAAAAVGMAAVLAVAMMTAPRHPVPGTTLPDRGTPVARAAAAGDRLELGNYGAWGGFGQAPGQRTVSTTTAPLAGGRPSWLDRDWSYRSMDDVRNFARIQQENRQLRGLVVQLQRQLQGMQSQLDTAGVPAVDVTTSGQ